MNNELLDVVKRLDPQGKIARIAEVLESFQLEQVSTAPELWNDFRRGCRVTLAQYAFIVRNTRHIRNDNERHAARTEAMMTMAIGIWYAPPDDDE